MTGSLFSLVSIYGLLFLIELKVFQLLWTKTLGSSTQNKHF
jgi:hypothetical protein